MSDGYVPAPPQAPEPPQRRGGGATFGLILIVIGVVLLVARFVPGLAWWSVWPLLIIIPGVIQAVTPGREGWSVFKLLDGLVTISIGVALLAWTTGRMGGGFVGNFLSMWPVLVIALGVDLLGKALHARWMKAIGPVLIIAAVAFVMTISAGQGSGRFEIAQGHREEVAFSEPVNGASEARLKLNAGVAGVRIGSGSDLVSVDGTSPFGEPDITVERSGNTADVAVKLAGDGVFLPGVGDASLDIGLSDQVAWDMLLEVGVSELDADLSGLNVRSLELKPGVADCTVKLGEPSRDVTQSTARIDAGISTIRVRVPEGVQARVESESGLTGHSVRGDFESVGSGVWETPGYDSASGGTWLIRIKSGIGSIDIDTY